MFYPTELDRKVENCGEVEQFGERYDSRYKKLGLEVTEFEMQDENGVLDILER